ncbi:MAG: hypothetical protein ACRYGM_04925, partial [Janthinobacterium lividum]
MRVTQVAGEVERRLGVAEWQDRPLAGLIGDTLGAKVAVLLQPGAIGGFMGQLQASTGERLDVSAHLSGPYVIVELEEASAGPLSASFLLDRLAAAAAAFERAISLAPLCDRAAIEFRRLTGFDRVMVCRFLEDDAGRVLAEDRRDDLHGFLNHHFPASDIPRQARAPYLRNRVRVIPDASYASVA